MSSIFNSEGWKKAVGTYKNNQAAPKTVMPTGAISALNNRPTPPQPGLPPAAIKAASNVRAGIPTAPTVPPAATAAAQRMVSATSQPRTEQALSAQANLVNTPFAFNPESDPSYQAAIRDADNKLLINQKNTNAQLRATGQGKSSYSETVANQLANQSAENIANNIMPIYAQKAYQQYQDSIGNQRNLYQDYNQQDFQNPITESQVTGNYMPAEAMTAYKQILANKQAAESPTITRDQRASISSETDALRDTLKRLGIDISGLGADKTAAQAGTVNPGIRTLVGQAQDQSTKNANLDAATAVSNMTGKVITPQTDWQGLVRQAANPNTPLNANQQNTQFNQNLQNRQQTFNEGQQGWSNQFDQAKFDEDTRRYGLDYALQQQQIAISQQNANTSRQGAASGINNTNFNQQMDIWKATGAAPAGLEAYGVTPGERWYEGAQGIKEGGLTVNQVVDNVRSIYQEPITKKELNPLTGQMVETDTGKTRITTDPGLRKKMFDNVVDSSLGSSKETMQALSSLGLTKEEIEKFYNEGMQSSGE